MSEEENWSLKGKLAIFTDDYGQPANMYMHHQYDDLDDDTVKYADEDEKYYQKEDIETLRKKLIEDIENMCSLIFTKEVYDVNIQTFREIIDKRFGIDR